LGLGGLLCISGLLFGLEQFLIEPLLPAASIAIIDLAIDLLK